MGANRYAKDVDNEKFLLYRTVNGEERIHGEYNNLKTLNCAFSHISKYPNHYKGSTFRIRKVIIAIVDISMSENEQKRIEKMAAEKNIKLVEEYDAEIKPEEHKWVIVKDKDGNEYPDHQWIGHAWYCFVRSEDGADGKRTDVDVVSWKYQNEE